LRGVGASEPLLGPPLRLAWRSRTTHALGTGMLTPFHLAGCSGTGQPVVGCGAMAQLVARLHGMQKVRGSNPLSSTAFFGSLFKGKAPNQEPILSARRFLHFRRRRRCPSRSPYSGSRWGMYVDKPLAGVAAAQALSRLQRTPAHVHRRRARRAACVARRSRSRRGPTRAVRCMTIVV
jgi:hypothetical protein